MVIARQRFPAGKGASETQADSRSSGIPSLIDSASCVQVEDQMGSQFISKSSAYMHLFAHLFAFRFPLRLLPLARGVT